MLKNLTWTQACFSSNSEFHVISDLQTGFFLKETEVLAWVAQNPHSFQVHRELTTLCNTLHNLYSFFFNRIWYLHFSWSSYVCTCEIVKRKKKTNSCRDSWIHKKCSENLASPPSPLSFCQSSSLSVYLSVCLAVSLSLSLSLSLLCVCVCVCVPLTFTPSSVSLPLFLPLL